MSDTGSMDNEDNHLARVRKWLDENVANCYYVKELTLHSFEYDREEYRGTFKVQFDDLSCEERFMFWLGESDGYPKTQIPMFHSPLGAPASYAAVSMLDETKEAIFNAVRKLFPRIAPYGLNSVTGLETSTGTPIEERITNRGDYENAVQGLLEAGFEVFIDLRTIPRD